MKPNLIPGHRCPKYPGEPIPGVSLVCTDPFCTPCTVENIRLLREIHRTKTDADATGVPS